MSCCGAGISLENDNVSAPTGCPYCYRIWSDEE
jgi:hypothetical protein